MLLTLMRYRKLKHQDVWLGSCVAFLNESLFFISSPCHETKSNISPNALQTFKPSKSWSL